MNKAQRLQRIGIEVAVVADAPATRLRQETELFIVAYGLRVDARAFGVFADRLGGRVTLFSTTKYRVPN